MITNAIKNCIRLAKEKGWPKTYWAFDVHGTILRSNFRRDEISREFYPHAKEVLQILSKRSDIVKILYTCSYPNEIKQYMAYFEEHGIHLDYVNENPEVADGSYGYYEDKFYFNVLMDDKAGFNGEKDWLEIKTIVQNL